MSITLYNEFNFLEKKEKLYGKNLKFIEVNIKGVSYIYGKLAKFMI